MPPPPPRSTLFPYTTLFRSSPATAGAGKTLEHASIRLRRQPRVGMQEQQHVAAGACRAGIHLSGAPARRRDDHVSMRPGKVARGVTAAAVHHDDLGPALAEWFEGPERIDDEPGLVQHRHDDREFCCQFVKRSFAAGPPRWRDPARPLYAGNRTHGRPT